MVNLLITMGCNRNCRYCFAREKRKSYDKGGYPIDMSLDYLSTILDFLESSGCDALQLAGGEPTLHQEFDEILRMVLDREIYVNVLSNCLWDPEKNKLFSKIAPTRLGFLINIDDPSTYSKTEWSRIEENLSNINDRKNTTLSFNIFEKEPRCDYIFDLVSRYNIKNLRLSFAMPVKFGDWSNTYLELSDYMNLSSFVMDYVKRSEDLGATVRMDNTVPVCMFSKEELGDLLIKGIVEPMRNFVCFPAIDIGPDGSIWRCFGTSGLYNTRLEDFSSLREIYEFYERALYPLQFKCYPFDECEDCEYARDKICQGGCIGFAAAKCMNIDKTISETKSSSILDMDLILSEDVEIRAYEIPQKTLILSRGDQIFELPYKMKDLLDILDDHSVRSSLNIFAERKTETEGTTTPIEEFLKNLIIEETLPYLQKLYQEEFLIKT